MPMRKGANMLGRLVIGIAAFVTGGATLVAPASAELPLHWDGGIYSYKTYDGCQNNTKKGIIDPIGVVFHGSAGTYNELGDYPVPSGPPPKNHIGKHTGWHYVGGKKGQYYFNHGSCYKNPSDHNMGKVKKAHLDYHSRFWDQVGIQGYHHRLIGTPHMDEHDKGKCDSDHVPAKMRLPNGGTGSGFDYARQRLYNAFRSGEAHDHHVVRTEYWSNNRPVGQCGGKYVAHSNGHVAIIRTGKP